MVMANGENPKTIKALNQNGLNAILYQLIKKAGGTITVPLSFIVDTPKDANFISSFSEITQEITVSIDMSREQIIQIPKSRIIV